MAANILAGEVGIIAEGREYIFRPSFRKLANLSDPVGLVDLFTQVQRHDRSGFLASLSVLTSFIDCSSEDAQKLLGFYKDVGGKLRYVRGLIREPTDLFLLSIELLKNGMIGGASKGSSDGKAAAEFNCLDFVGSAIAHLGLQPTDAWEMTMPELQAAISAKIGNTKEDKRPNGVDIDNLWKEIDECRSKSTE